MLLGAIRPKPLHVEVRDETTREGFTSEVDDSVSREELERSVILELLEHGNYSDSASEIHSLICDIRDAVVNKSSLDGFDRTLREIALQLPRKDDDPGNDEAEANKDEAETGKNESEAGNNEAEESNDESEAGKNESEAGNNEAEAGKNESEAGKDEAEAGNNEIEEESIGSDHFVPRSEKNRSDP